MYPNRTIARAIAGNVRYWTWVSAPAPGSHCADQHEPRYELRYDRERQPDDGDRAVGRPSNAEAGEHAAEDPERHHEEKREDRQLHGVDERGLEDAPYRLVRLCERYTEVASHDPAHPVGVLDDRRPVRAVLVVVRGHRLLRCIRPQDRSTHVAGQELRGREDDRAEEEERDQREAEALEGVACDGGSAVWMSGCRRVECRQPVLATCLGEGSVGDAHV
jgi:hypothetical protein